MQRTRGFYMSIDITIAAGLAMIILMLLLVTFANIPRSDAVEVGNYKHGESVLYSLKHAGTLQQAVEYMDEGKEGQARGLVVSELAAMQLSMYPTLKLETYDNMMGEVSTLVIQKGPSTGRRYAISMPFKPNSTLSKFAIATLEVGI